MNRFLKVFGLIAFIAVFASCKKDDSPNVAPPRDYAVQNAADMDSITKFLKTHYIVLDETTLEANFPEITEGVTEPSIWDNTEYPLLSTVVHRNDIDYTIYYLNFRQGVSDAPCGVDDVTINYRGTLLDGTQFDYRPVVGEGLSLNSAIAGWQDIIPFFNSGNPVVDGGGNPVSYTDFGAGAMFLPSGLAYFNGSASNVMPTYSCLVFSFQLFDVTYTDLDGDKILNKDEFEWAKKKDPVTGEFVKDPETGEFIWEKIPVIFSDTDGDGIPNYADVDDDNDGRLTRDEIRKQVRGAVTGEFKPSPTEYWTYAEMFDVNGNVKLNVEDDPATPLLKEESFGCGEDSARKDSYSNVPKYMDKGCKGGVGAQ